MTSATLPHDRVRAVLIYLDRPDRYTGTATHWMSSAAGHPNDTAATRRFLKKLARVGYVEGVAATRTGRVYWWRITDAGRDYLNETEVPK